MSGIHWDFEVLVWDKEQYISRTKTHPVYVVLVPDVPLLLRQDNQPARHFASPFLVPLYNMIILEFYNKLHDCIGDDITVHMASYESLQQVFSNRSI